MATPSTAKAPPRPEGPCDIYAAAGDPCAAAHSTTRALYASYNGPLYQVLRQSDGATLDIGVVQPVALPFPDAGGYADAAAQDAFCADTYCWITKIYDQSGHGNDLTQPPRGGFVWGGGLGPAMGGFLNISIADMAPVTVMGHKVYGVFIEPGMGYRQDDPHHTAVDDQAEGQYWVINGHHYNSGCCMDYGNAEISSDSDGYGTMETNFFGNGTSWYHGPGSGPWIMTDQEHNVIGCVRFDSASKECPDLPSIHSRFVTATADGEPGHWRSMGGDAQGGPLTVMFDGPRIDRTYDPMRKQGAILLGHGGDNSDAGQGTFYEGAMTTGGTFPSEETNQAIQDNVAAAGYDVQRLSIGSRGRAAPASAVATPPGLQTFAPGSAHDTTVTFTNTTGSRAVGVKLSISLPTKQWTSFVSGTTETSKTFDEVPPGESVSATFAVTSGPAAFNGDLVGKAEWTNPTHGARQSETTAEKVRNVSPIKINEFRTGVTGNSTNSFIELYNAGDKAVDLSNWSLTEHAAQQAVNSMIKVPAGTTLGAGRFYLLGLADSGLAAPASAGDSTIYVRDTSGLAVGDTIDIDGESRTIMSVGTAASAATPLWQPLPDGPVITIPAGSTSVPVTSASDFKVGEKIALGHGATYPTVNNFQERSEVATVTKVGTGGTVAYLRAIARPGDTNISVSHVTNIRPGDRIRLDIDSLGHGIEWVTVKNVGTQARSTTMSGGNGYLAAASDAGSTNIKVSSVSNFVAGQTIQIGHGANIETAVIASVGTSGATGTGLTLTAPLRLAHPLSPVVTATPAGATNIKVDSVAGFQVGDKMDIGTCYACETVTVTAVGTAGASGTGVSFRPALTESYVSGQDVVEHGTGLDLAEPLKFEHASGLPFSDWGTGISFEPATAFPHSSNEPVQALGTGITLDRPLANNHPINAPVRDALVTTAGYQGTVAPNQWFGGPALATSGTMVLRDAADLVVDSLNYGAHVDPWAGEGYQGYSGTGANGCRAAAPSLAAGQGQSRGRFPDGNDTDSNCTDFLTHSTTSGSVPTPGGTNIYP